MGLVIGVLLLAAGIAVVWSLRSPDGFHSHPLVAKPMMGPLVALVSVSLTAGGTASIVAWALT